MVVVTPDCPRYTMTLPLLTKRASIRFELAARARAGALLTVTEVLAAVPVDCPAGPVAPVLPVAPAFPVGPV